MTKLKHTIIILMLLAITQTAAAQKVYYNFNVLTSQIIDGKVNIVVKNEFDEIESFDISYIDNEISISKRNEKNYKTFYSFDEGQEKSAKLKEFTAVVKDLEKEKQKLKQKLSAEFGWDVWVSYSPMLVSEYNNHTVILTRFEFLEGEREKKLYILDSSKKIIKKFAFVEDMEILTNACLLQNKLFLFYSNIKTNFTRIKIVDVDNLGIRY